MQEVYWILFYLELPYTKQAPPFPREELKYPLDWGLGVGLLLPLIPSP